MASLTKKASPHPDNLNEKGNVTARQHNIIIDRLGGENSLTGNRVLTTDTNGDMQVSTVTDTTLSYLDATSSLQTQLNSKSATGHLHVKADISDFAHTHPQSEITNLVTDLSNKSAVGHTHSASDIIGTAVLTNDSRLSDARTPLTHSHPISDVTNLQTSLDGKEPSLPSKTGNSLKYLRVNSGETALEWNTVSGSGEVNTQTNQGTGEGTLAKTKSGVDLPIKSLKQGTNITLTNNADDVTIAVSGLTKSSVGLGNVDNVQQYSASNRQSNITYSELQNVSATDRILGRDSSGAGVVEEITPANLRTMINVADGANNYTHPNHSGDVTSTGDGATVIANGAVDIAHLSAGGTPSSSTYLRGDNTWSTPAGGGISTLKKTATQTINGTAFQDINDLTFSVVSGTNYAFKFYIVFRSAATATGFRFGLNCPTGTLDYFQTYQTIANSATAGVATWLQRHDVTRDSMTALTATITAGVDLVCMIEGRYLCTQNGTFAARVASESANNDLVIQIGSWGTYF